MQRLILQLLLTILLLGFCDRAGAQDTIEFLSGAKLQGKVTRIDKMAKVMQFKAILGAQSVSREFPYDKIHAVVYQGKRAANAG